MERMQLGWEFPGGFFSHLFVDDDHCNIFFYELLWDLNFLILYNIGAIRYLLVILYFVNISLILVILMQCSLL